MREPEEFFEHLLTLGFDPKTILDVGVAWGTPPLYDAFPDARYYLFEALPMFEPTIKNIMKRLKGEYFITALSVESDERRQIYVGELPIQQAGASIFRAVPGPGKSPVTISLNRMDEMMDGKAVDTPLLIKVDAQGADIDVIRGGEKTAGKADMIILETGLYPFANPENQIFNVIEYMHSLNFVPYEFLSPRPRPLDGALGQIDVVFVKKDGALRASSSWA